MDVVSNKSRKDTRAVVSLVARYRSPSTFEYVQEACCDVSVGGMFIQSGDPAAAGTLLKLECEADDEGTKIRGVARVVWLRREPNEYGPSGMGVKFVKLEPGSREIIARVVQELAAAGIKAASISTAPESRITTRSAAPTARPAPEPERSVAPTSVSSRPTAITSDKPDASKVAPVSSPAATAPAVRAADNAPASRERVSEPSIDFDDTTPVSQSTAAATSLAQQPARLPEPADLDDLDEATEHDTETDDLDRPARPSVRTYDPRRQPLVVASASAPGNYVRLSMMLSAGLLAVLAVVWSIRPEPPSDTPEREPSAPAAASQPTAAPSDHSAQSTHPGPSDVSELPAQPAVIVDDAPSTFLVVPDHEPEPVPDPGPGMFPFTAADAEAANTPKPADGAKAPAEPAPPSTHGMLDGTSADAPGAAQHHDAPSAQPSAPSNNGPAENAAEPPSGATGTRSEPSDDSPKQPPAEGAAHSGSAPTAPSGPVPPGGPSSAVSSPGSGQTLSVQQAAPPSSKLRGSTAAQSSKSTSAEPDKPGPNTQQPTAAAQSAKKPTTALGQQTSISAATAAPSVKPSAPAPPSATNLPYVITFITRPSGATVTVGDRSVVAPADIELGNMPAQVKVVAQKDGFTPSSIALERAEFVRSGDAMRRRVYLTLPPLSPGASVPSRKTR
ncbi:MAG: PilZ domain-containing protein [Polyangiales bacterium]